MRHIINKYFLYKNEKCAIIQKCRAMIGKFGVLAQLVERQVRNLEVRGSTPLCSTKQVLDEHLFLQRRFRRKVFALIHNRKAPSWK